MEAAFFRQLVRELDPTLAGRRIEKVFEPAPGLWVLRLSPGDHGRFLVFRPHRSQGLLFLSDQAPENPAQPSSRAMWWRKRAQNRRITGAVSDWRRLRLALALSGQTREFAVFDVRQGLLLRQELDDDFDELAQGYPDLEEIVADPDIFRSHPHVSPPLRRRLARLPEKEGRALLERLEAGEPEGFFIQQTGQGPVRALCWPPLEGGESCASALEAAARTGHAQIFAQAEQAREHAPRVTGRRKLKRARGALERLQSEHGRLEEKLAGRRLGQVLQANLYQLDPEAGPESLRLPDPEGGEVDVPLDPRKTPVENMQEYFHQAARAERGLARLADRKQELEAELVRLQAEEGEEDQARQASGHARRSPLPSRFRGLPLSLFDSSDGFLILRGKNAKANDELVRRASPFDYWLHAAGVPGAHVLLRRDHPTEEVPRRSLEEAAALAALKSSAAGEAAADVLCAEARTVRKRKGAAPGAVAVDESRTLRVAVDPELERRLARETALK
jgi:predicted ribosome quality control (RQC) complex YloA/Tae2 family protein